MAERAIDGLGFLSNPVGHCHILEEIVQSQWHIFLVNLRQIYNLICGRFEACRSFWGSRGTGAGRGAKSPKVTCTSNRHHGPPLSDAWS